MLPVVVPWRAAVLSLRACKTLNQMPEQLVLVLFGHFISKNKIKGSCEQTPTYALHITVYLSNRHIY